MKGFFGLLVDFVKVEKVNVLICGLCIIVDFEYEFGFINMYCCLMLGLESVFLMFVEEYVFILLILVWEVVIYGGNVDEFVFVIVVNVLY